MREDVIKEIERFTPSCEQEKECKLKAIEYLKSESGDPFVRDNFNGHFTSGALVVSSDNMILLNHHKKSGMWFQFGGHCDGDTDLLNSAKREVYEESGLKDEDLVGLVDGIFNIDIQLIPNNETKGEGEHLHYDINYLLLTKNKDFTMSDESFSIKWCTIDEARSLIDKSDIGTLRMIEKFEKMVKEK